MSGTGTVLVQRKSSRKHIAGADARTAVRCVSIGFADIIPTLTCLCISFSRLSALYMACLLRRKRPRVDEFEVLTRDMDALYSWQKPDISPFIERFRQYAAKNRISCLQLRTFMTLVVQAGFYTPREKIGPIVLIVKQHATHLTSAWVPFEALFASVLDTICTPKGFRTNAQQCLDRFFETVPGHPFSARGNGVKYWNTPISTTCDFAAEQANLLAKHLRILPSLTTLIQTFKYSECVVERVIRNNDCVAPMFTLTNEYERFDNILSLWEQYGYYVGQDEHSDVYRDYWVGRLLIPFGHFYQHRCWPHEHIRSIFYRFIARFRVHVVFHDGYKYCWTFESLLPLLLHCNITFEFKPSPFRVDQAVKNCFVDIVTELLRTNRSNLVRGWTGVIAKFVRWLQPNGSPFEAGVISNQITLFLLHEPKTKLEQVVINNR